MATVNDEGTKYILGPLRTYRCDGVSIQRIRNNVYSVATYESRGGSPNIFNPENSEDYDETNSNGVGYRVHVYMTNEELEELFLAWQMLKKVEES